MDQQAFVLPPHIDLQELRCRFFSLLETNYFHRFIAGERVQLPFRELVITEKCLGGCCYCGNCRSSKGRSMPWKLFEDIFQSPQLTPYAAILFLGDGEVLLYEDKEQGKTLIHLVTSVLEKGLIPQFTTAGLIPQNRELGVPFFSDLKKLGLKYGAIRVSLSLNLIDAWRYKDPEKYLAAMEETIKLLVEANCFIRLIRIKITDSEDAEKVYGSQGLRAEDLMDDFVRSMLDQFRVEYNKRRIYPTGKALRTPRLTHLFEDISCRDTKCCLNPEDMELYSKPVFSITPVGDILVCCGYYGNSFTPLGNIFKNDALQVHKSFQTFYFALEDLHARTSEKPFSKCEAHRRWRRNFGSRKPSPNPIVHRPALAVR